jgi:hypothetical protein
MTFDARTAYAGEYQFLDRILGAILVARDANGRSLDLDQDVKVRERDISSTSFAAAIFSFAGRTTVWEVWDAPNREPQEGDALQFAPSGSMGMVRWHVHKVIKTPWGNLECLCSTIGTGAPDDL